VYCKKVKLTNFRNVSEAEIEFCDGINILAGENAQGKTNLLEAIFYASVGRSFRASSSNEMILFGKKNATVSIDYLSDKKERSDNITIRLFSDKKKTVEKNHLRVERLSDIVGSFRSVLFCPEHLSLIKDGPLERRTYLDIAISRISPKYIHSLQRYAYFLKQRNALIKSAAKNREVFDATVDLWSEQLATEAAEISAQRLQFIKRVANIVTVCFEEMTGKKESVDIIYRGSASLSGDEYLDKELVKQKYIDLLSSSHDREIFVGSTLWGIHKDDIEIKLNSKNARAYASQGQQRSLALALKLAEGEICREEFGDYPVFLFDDVLSELDDTRRDYMIRFATGKQVIITTCEMAVLNNLQADKKILVESGTYRELKIDN
jgi:DNA replication and repair protein RecF